MLVLTTMFVSVSNDLPKTSYMKMVDIWMIFNLIIPFVEVLLHVYKETFFGTEEEDDDMRSKTKRNIVQVESNENKEENLELEIQVLINLSTGHLKNILFSGRQNLPEAHKCGYCVKSSQPFGRSQFCSDILGSWVCQIFQPIYLINPNCATLL